MKDDQELEDLLRRYEPAAPRASLRSRVIASSVREPRAWPWAVAAAALVVLAVGLATAAARVIEPVDADSATSQRALEVEALASIVGDADNPRALAEWMIDRRDADRALESPPQAVATTGVGR